MAAVCVYCASAEPIDAHFLELATAVGSGLAERGYSLVSGGGRVSMMGAVAAAARAGGAHTVGVIPQALVGWEVADDDADELLVTPDMRSRKAAMDERSDAFIALPGGIGTLEELFEIWVSRSLGMHAKPVLVLDPDGVYSGLRAVVETLEERGFVRPEARALLGWARTVPEALDLVEAELAGRGPSAGGPPPPPPPPEELLETEVEAQP
jgi:uncharacterized protein (TIGR00730 family)